LYSTLEEIQVDLYEWARSYNELQPYSGKYCYGKTPMQKFLDSKRTSIEKNYYSIEGVSDSTNYLAKIA